MKKKIFDIISIIKKEFLNIKVFLLKDKFKLIVFGLSFIILIIGSVIFNFFIGLLLFIVTNLIWIIPFVNWRKKLTDRNKIRSARTSSRVKKAESIDDSLNKKTDKGSVGMPRKRKNKKKKSFGKKILLGLLSFFLLCIVLAIVFCVYIALTAGKFNPNKLYSKEASTLLDSNGQMFAKLGTEMRQKISYDNMSEELVNAIIATEDSRFFEHNGFDLPRFLKASFGQALGQNAGGASTLTMQVSKNQYTSNVAHGLEGIKRKFTDIYIAMFQIEKNYSKEQILEFYANSYYLGSGAYGVEQAAQTYFDKNAKDLNVAESAMIAGLFQSPVVYDPNLNPEKTEARRKIVLSLMKRHGYINDKEYEIAKKMTVDKIVIKGRKSTTSNSKYQGFIDTVAREVEEKTGYNPYSYSMKIYTTMDREKQDKITDIMNGTSFNWENDKVEAGIIALDAKTGAIVALGGGRNKEGAMSRNNATQIKRQIGSTAKPMFDYGPAIEYNNWNPSQLILDEKYTYSNGTEINNWDGRYKGMMTIRQALIESRNIPALKTFQNVKNEDIVKFVQSIGLSPEVDSSGKIHEAHAIGGYTGESPMTVAGAYESFANGGFYVEPYSFTKIEFDKNGKTYENKIKKEQVMSPETAYMVTSMLIDTGKEALGRYSNINGAEFGAKTGTTNFDKKTKALRNLPDNAVNDLWVAGISPDYAIAVWYGYESHNDGYNKFGSSQNSRLFQTVAKNFFKSDSKFTRPNDVVEVTVEKNCGEPLLPGPNTPDSAKTVELFKANAKPTEVSARFNVLPNVTGLKASVSGNYATLSWNTVGTPDGLNEDYWRSHVNKAYSSSREQSVLFNYVMGYNRSVLGSVVYEVYIKNGDGMTLLTTSNSGSATVKLPNIKSPKLVVKTAYSAYKGSSSSGVEVNVDYNGISANDVKISLNGKENIEITTDTNYIDEKPPVKVTAGGDDITSEVSIQTTITDSSGSEVKMNEIHKKAGSYTIKYEVSYEGVNVGSLSRKIIVKE